MVSKERHCEFPALGWGGAIFKRIPREVTSQLKLLARTERRFYMKSRITMLAALVSCLVFLVGVGFAEKETESPPGKASPIGEKLKEPANNVQPTEKATDRAPSEIPRKKHPEAEEIKPVQPQPTPVQPAPEIQPAQLPQPETQPAPVFWDKGRNIKWQVLSGGGSNSTSSKGHRIMNVVSQTAAGYTSSSSHQALQGFLMGGEAEGFLRGDANHDGVINLGDGIYILNYLFKHGLAPVPIDAGDANCDGATQLGDAIYILNYLFKHGPPPGC
jgi:hypothetical protein